MTRASGIIDFEQNGGVAILNAMDVNGDIEEQDDNRRKVARANIKYDSG